MRELGLRPALSLLINRQRRYGYRILSSPKLQPTRDILPTTFQQGGNQAQPGELPEGDDDWFKPIGRESETLGQRLTRTIAEVTSINTISGMEHIEWLEEETFPRGIAPFTETNVEGAKEMKRYVDGPDEISF